jgi:hypothetical protein
MNFTNLMMNLGLFGLGVAVYTIAVIIVDSKWGYGKDNFVVSKDGLDLYKSERRLKK